MRLAAEQDQFLIILPEGYPRPQRQVEHVPHGDRTLAFIQYISPQPRGVCAIILVDYAEDISLLDTETILDTGQEGLLEDIPHTILLQESHGCQGYPGRLLRYSEVDEGQTLYTQVQFVYVHPRMYQVYFSTNRPEALEDPDIQYFFKSFEILAN